MKPGGSWGFVEPISGSGFLLRGVIGFLLGAIEDEVKASFLSEEQSEQRLLEGMFRSGDCQQWEDWAGCRRKLSNQRGAYGEREVSTTISRRRRVECCGLMGPDKAFNIPAP